MTTLCTYQIDARDKTSLEMLNLDPSIFNLQTVKFDKVSPYPIQQEYLFKDYSSNPNNLGSYLINLNSFVNTFSEKETLDNTSSLIYQIFNNPPKQFNKSTVELTKAFYFLVLPEQFKDAKLLEAFVKKVKTTKTGAYNCLLTALILKKKLNSKKLDLKVKRDFEAILLKAVHGTNADAMFFYALGNFYFNFFKDQNTLTKLRLITLNYEKSRARDHRNRNLFVYITSKYIELHTHYQEHNINMPFAFEELVYKRVILLDPKNPMAHNNLADLYSNQNVQLKEALKEAEIANKLEENNPSILDTLGYCLYKNKKFKKSVEVFKKAIQLDPSQAISYFHLASAYYDLKKFPLAIVNFKKAIELEPNNSLTLNNLAYLYSELNQNLDEALIMSQRALKRAPKNPAYLDTLAWIYYQQGRYKEAKTILDKVLVIDPESVESRAHLDAVEAKLNPNATKTPKVEHHDHDQGSHPQEKQIFKSSSKNAYDLLYQSILNAKDSYIANNQNNLKKADVKVFYDQLISISSNQGDYIKLYQFMKEFETLDLSKNTEVKTTESALSPQFNSFYNFFPEKPQLFVHAKKSALTKMYNKAFEIWSKNSKLEIDLTSIQQRIIQELPNQLAISLYKPNADTKLQILACSKLTEQKLQTIHKNLEIFAGRPITIPGNQDIHIEIQSLNLHTYQVKAFGTSIFIHLKDQHLIVSNSIVATNNLPHDDKVSLNSNVSFINFLKSAKDFKHEIKLFSDDFSSFNQGLDKQTLAIIKEVTNDFNLLENIASYIAFLNFDNNTFKELEYIGAKSSDQVKSLVQSIESASKHIEDTLLKNNSHKITSEIVVKDSIIEISTEISNLDQFIQTIIDKVKLNYKHIEKLVKPKKDNNNDK